MQSGNKIHNLHQHQLHTIQEVETVEAVVVAVAEVHQDQYLKINQLDKLQWLRVLQSKFKFQLLSQNK